MSSALGLLGLTLGAVLLLGGLVRPAWALAAVALLFPLEQVISSLLPFFAAYSKVFNFAVGITALISVCTSFARGEAPLRGYFSVTAVASLALYMLATVSLLWSPQPHPVAEMLGIYVPPVILGLVVAPLLPRNLDDYREFAKVMLVFGTIICLLVLVNPTQKNVWGRLMLEIAGGTSNPLALSELGGSLLIIGAFLMPTGLVGRTFWTVVRAAAALLGTALLFAASARGQVFSALGAIFIFWPMARKIRSVGQFLGIGLLAGLLGGLGMLGLQLFFVSGSERRWDPARILTDILGRFDAVATLLSTWLRTPMSWFFGLGNGAYETIDPTLPYVHNTPVECLGELGLAGGALYSIAFVGMIIACRNLWRAWRHDPSMRWVAALIAAMLFDMFVLSLKQGQLWGSYKFFMYGIIAVRLSKIDIPEELPPETGVPPTHS